MARSWRCELRDGEYFSLCTAAVRWEDRTYDLRKLDSAGFSIIHAELARGGGLAEAINDRLRRAAAR